MKYTRSNHLNINRTYLSNKSLQITHEINGFSFTRDPPLLKAERPPFNQ